MTNVDEKEPSPLAVHKDAWSQKDLLEGIIQRYIPTRSHVGGLWPTWEIEADQADEKLPELNSYLERLGWMARLQRGDVDQLTTIPLPHHQFPGSRIHIYMWTASLITLLLSALRWMENGRPSGGWFVESEVLDALIGFAFPVLFTLFLASYIQTRISAKLGVRTGHILPIPDPSVLLWLFSGLSTSFFIWPFGIFFIPTLPRMDARPWPDRKSLAWTSVSVPIVLLVSGFVFWTLGLILAPDAYLLTGEPYRANPPFLIELISTAFDTSFQTTLDWGHPFFFAAAFLTLVGWLLMLPIPTFPGGRLLVARMGIQEARSSGTQILMFMLLVTAALFIFDAFNGFTIWIPVLSVAIPLLLFMGGDSRIPVLIDGDRPLNEENHRRLGLVLFIAILFAIPSQFPVEPVERWDAEATYSLDVDAYAELGDVWNASVMIILENPSMENRNYTVAGSILGTTLWTAELSCGGEICDGQLEPGDATSIQLVFTHENTSYQPTFLDYQIDVTFDKTEHQEIGTIHPNMTGSVGAEWYHLRSGEEVLTCLDIYLEEIANISFPDLSSDWIPFLWLEGQVGLNQTLETTDDIVCLDGVDQALPYNVQSYLRNVALGNATFVVGFDSTWPHIVSASGNGWFIDEQHPIGTPFNQEGTLYQENESSCPDNENLVTPEHNGSPIRNWNLEVRSANKIPSIGSGEALILKLAPNTYIHCYQEKGIATKFSIQEGPNLILYDGSEPIRLWDAPRTATSTELTIALFNNGTSDVVLRHSTFGDVEWDLQNLTDSLSPGWNNLTLGVPSSIINTYQLTHQDGAILITFGGYLEAES